MAASGRDPSLDAFHALTRLVPPGRSGRADFEQAGVRHQPVGERLDRASGAREAHHQQDHREHGHHAAEYHGRSISGTTLFETPQTSYDHNANCPWMVALIMPVGGRHSGSCRRPVVIDFSCVARTWVWPIGMARSSRSAVPTAGRPISFGSPTGMRGLCSLVRTALWSHGTRSRGTRATP